MNACGVKLTVSVFDNLKDDFGNCLYLCIMTRALLIKRGMVAREG